MPDIVLNAETGRTLGSRASRRLRAVGKVPGVLYGHGSEPVTFAVDGRDLRHALSTPAGTNALLSVQIGSSHQLAMVKDMQRDALRGTALHVDLVVVGRHERIEVDVPVVLVGEALAVHRAGGNVEQEAFTLRMRASADDIPESIEVDVSEMEIGQLIRLGDITLPNNVEPDGEADLVLVAAHSAAAGEPEVAATEEAAEQDTEA